MANVDDTASRSKPAYFWWMGVGALVLLLSAAAGYELRIHSADDGGRPAARTASDSASRVAIADPQPEPAPPVVQRDSVVRVDTVFVQNGFAPDPSDAQPVTTYLATEETSYPSGVQVLLPPEDSPAANVPSNEMLAELLYGQQLVAKNAWGNFGWTVERGEIIELTIDRVWQDPESISHGLYLTFVVMANGKGMRASGLLRYYGSGSEGDGYGIRDFTPHRVERVGSW